MSPSISGIIMGCMPSRQRNTEKSRNKQNNGGRDDDRTSDEQQSSNAATEYGKPDMNPKISMMSDHTLKLLQEIGELKVFTQVNPSESKQKINRHLDILLALENPQSILPGGTTKSDVSGLIRSK